MINDLRAEMEEIEDALYGATDERRRALLDELQHLELQLRNAEDRKRERTQREAEEHHAENGWHET